MQRPLGGRRGAVSDCKMLNEERGDINVVFELREREQQETRNDQNALRYPGRMTGSGYHVYKASASNFKSGIFN